ncbi:DUF6809 family protein [Bittarella massiliensis (ex Durand et al. 2017)]|uniref:DUF6809 family protein n=1 Tax=Bittarella massiliensis (ex Durand et al. 2017) TaxID=1720313 RepID=UPI001AA0E912|nr:hypothetical protein [Bittarella massiliensis (ex Durand et al. 2017)]
MKPILEMLYNGEIFPAEQFCPQIGAHREAYRRHAMHQRAFIERLKGLNPPLHNEYMDIVDEQLDEDPLELEEAFADGFRLGARIAIDVFSAPYEQGD